jgi:anti-sigma factor ChrR (cupin superfamily)
VSCDKDLLHAYALGALPASEALLVRGHVEGCALCRQELDSLRLVVDAFIAWPTDVLRPSSTLWERLSQRLAPENDAEPSGSEPARYEEPQWAEVAPGISCKLLASDAQTGMVSMLVRLAPGVAYPPHTHASFEELHLLDGELWIEDRNLVPGDYNRAEAGTSDSRVWSETGCTCVLITSARDVLR